MLSGHLEGNDKLVIFNLSINYMLLICLFTELFLSGDSQLVPMLVLGLYGVKHITSASKELDPSWKQQEVNF